jgi:hypothetical protein
MFLFAKHDRVVEVENDSGIGPAQHGQLERAEAERLEKDDDIVAGGLLHDAKPAGQIGPARGKDRRLDAEAGVMRKRIAQAQARARRVSVFDYAKGPHPWESSLPPGLGESGFRKIDPPSHRYGAAGNRHLILVGLIEACTIPRG